MQPDTEQLLPTGISPARTPRQFWSDLLLRLTLLLISALYALLMLKDSVPPVAFLALAGLGLLYWAVINFQCLTTPLDLPLLLLLSLLPLNLLLTADRILTLPKVYGLLLSILLCLVISRLVKTFPRIKLAIWALIILSLAISLLGVLGADWSGTRLASLPSIFDYVPRTNTDVGIHVNTIGGALAFLIPLLLSLLWDKGAYSRSFQQSSPIQSSRRTLYKLFIVLVLLFCLGLLVLTRSRGAFLGVTTGILTIAVVKDRRFLWFFPLALFGGVLAFLIFGRGDLSLFLRLLDTTREDATLPGRLEIWHGAIRLVRDFPLTGSGLGTFSNLFGEFYSFGKLSFHAHNLILTIAVDMGLPTLVLYFCLLGSFAWMAIKTYHAADPLIKVLVLGLACGMLSHQVFGIMDSYIMGAKLAVVMWIYIGLMAALYQFQFQRKRKAQPTRHLVKKKVVYLGFVLLGITIMILAPLAFVSFNPYISLLIAVTGGCALGVFLSKQHHALLESINE